MIDRTTLPIVTGDEPYDGAQARLGEQMRDGDTAFDAHTGKAAAPRRGGLRHPHIIRECHATVCPSGLDQCAIRFGVVDGSKERFTLLVVSQDAGHAGQGRQMLLRHGPRTHDAD